MDSVSLPSHGALPWPVLILCVFACTAHVHVFILTACSNYDGPPPHAHCRHSSETQLQQSGCLFHMFIFTGESHPTLRPSTSFRLLLSAALSCGDEWGEMGLGKDRKEEET